MEENTHLCRKRNKKEMLNVSEKEKCCGCGACYQVCPVNAVEMVWDEEGFKYPAINKEVCVDCGMCENVCPVFCAGSGYLDSLHLAVATRSNNPDVLEKSTSGGISYELAKYIIEKDGVVFGACYDKDFVVCHKKIQSLEELKDMQGSKYVQSDVRRTYLETKQLLEKEVLVYYTGTPCQIEGLITFLGKDYDNLITQDLICHGTPSPQMWDKYLKETGYCRANNIVFRDKKKGWETKSEFVVKYPDKEIRYPFYKDAFCFFFGQNYSLRPICYECPFKSGNKKADLTCADLWGISEILPEELRDDKGMSLLLVHSEKGRRLLENIKHRVFIKEISYEQAVAHNMMALKSVIRPERREEFFGDLKLKRIKPLYKKYRPKESVILQIKKKLYWVKVYILEQKRIKETLMKKMED